MFKSKMSVEHTPSGKSLVSILICFSLYCEGSMDSSLVSRLIIPISEIKHKQQHANDRRIMHNN